MKNENIYISERVILRKENIHIKDYPLSDFPTIWYSVKYKNIIKALLELSNE